LEWSPQQELALYEISKWLGNAKGPQLFRLFGYAGTGKTTLISEIADLVKGQVLYMAYTGKAALIMRKKGCDDARTIHSSIYRAVEDKKTGKVEFVLNYDAPVATASLVIIDEVSMVNQEIGEDLLQFGKKILIIGDPFQLPPVKGEGYFTSDKPDVMLTEIHRQARDNPIIRLASDIREGKNLRNQTYDECKVFSRSLIEDVRFDNILSSVDQVICGMNKTRVNLNNRIRLVKGLANPEDLFEPRVGDKLICIKNNRKKGLLNGGLWKVNTVAEAQSYYMNLTSLDELGDDDFEAKVPKEFFMGTEDTLDWRYRKSVDEFTFGEALTAHKSQGSQWASVLVVDESRVFREHAARHLYTAVTRAAEKVYVAI
jgi:exodeoxyribonuclease-5